MINHRFDNNAYLTSIVKLNKAQFEPWVENMEIVEILKQGPARLPAKRGQYRAACKLRSHAMHKDIDVDGSWASVVAKAAELDWRSHQVYSEPLVVELGSGLIRQNKEKLVDELLARGKRKRDLRFYTADLAVVFRDDSVRFYEIKCEEHYDPNNVNFCKGKKWLACHGYSLDTVLDTDFKKTALSLNVHRLYQYLHPIGTKALTPIEEADVRRAFDSANAVLSLGELSRKLNVALTSAIPLFLSGLIASDFNAGHISRHMPVWLATDRTHLEFLP